LICEDLRLLYRSISHALKSQSAQIPIMIGENHLPYSPSGENFSVAICSASLFGNNPASVNSWNE
jgi:hypothetical protein